MFIILMWPRGEIFEVPMETKPATSYKDQVEKLCSRGLLITDKKECENFLKCTNYYRFSAYLLPFKKKDGTYKEGTSFEQVRKIYEFDTELRNIVFRMIEIIELFLRTQFAYYFAHHYTQTGYLNPQNFSRLHNHEAFVKHIRTCIEENRNTPIVIHHRTKYDGNFPIWVIIELFSIGMLSRFYADMKRGDQRAIAITCHYPEYRFVSGWLKCLTELRNRCAHYARLYYWEFISIPGFPKDIKKSENSRLLFNQILVLKYLCPQNSYWNTFKIRLSALISEYSDAIELTHIGFPEDWDSIL